MRKLFLTIIFILSFAVSAWGANYTITTATTSFDGSSDCGGGACTSSDTIIIEGGTRGKLTLQNFDGSGSYISIVNENTNPDSRVIINDDGTSVGGVLRIDNCQYIDLKGNNDADLTYGILVQSDSDDDGDTSASVFISGLSSNHIKISYLEIDNVGSSRNDTSGIQVGAWATSSAVTWDTFEISHNYIHDIRFCGMYLGMNQPSNDEYVRNFSIHDNLIEDVGSDGILYKGLASGGTELIYNNVIDNIGILDRVGYDQEYKSGIRYRSYGNYSGSIYQNKITNAKGPGITSENSHIYENLMAHTGYDNTMGCSADDGCESGILVYDPDSTGYTGMVIEDNIIIDAETYGIYNYDTGTNGLTLTANLIGGVATGYCDTGYKCISCLCF